MDDDFGPLRISTAGANRLSTRSSESGNLRLHPTDLLPCVHRFERDLVVDDHDQSLRSTHLISLLRGQLNGEQVDGVKKLLSDLRVQFPLSPTQARGSTPSYPRDSDTARAGSALLALKEVSSQAAEVESGHRADAQR